MKVDLHSNCASHYEVVVVTVDSSVLSPFLLLIDKQFVDAVFVALDVETIADNPLEIVDNHRLCSHVGVESVDARGVFADFFGRLFSGIQVRVIVLEFVEDERSVVGFSDTAASVGVEGVFLYNEQGVVVEPCNLRGEPGNAVHISFAVPLRDDIRLTAVHTVKAVEHGYNGEVGFSGESLAEVDNSKVTVGNSDTVDNIIFGHIPNGEVFVATWDEPYVLQRIGTDIGISGN